MFIKPLTLGNLTLPTNLIQGPLAGYSCAPFREMVWQHSTPAYCCTEMMSAKDLVNRPQQNNRFTHISDTEGPVCFQLSGNDPVTLGKATAIVSELGANLIDLNCGCPKPKIRVKGTGSKLLQTPELIHNLVAAMKANTEVPVSIKIRIDGASKDNYNLAVIEAAEQGGVDFIVVHGRHWQDDYDTACHLEQVAEIVAHASVPIIANGDVHDTMSCRETLSKTGCAGIMISRASVGQPWLFQQIETELSGQNFQAPNLDRIKSLFYTHVLKLAELESEISAILQSRSLAKYYFREGLVDNDFFNKIYKLDKLESLEKFLTE